MNGCIYFHINKTSGKVYVGQSRNVKDRWRSRYKEQPYFYNAINKYGWNGFDHIIVVDGVGSQTELNNLEKLWIILLRSTDPYFGYNLIPGGYSGSSELGRMGGISANKNPENRNRLKAVATFESCSRGGQVGGRINADSGWSSELGFYQGNKNKQSGHWDRIRQLGTAFTMDHGRKQGLKNANKPGYMKFISSLSHSLKDENGKSVHAVKMGSIGGKKGGLATSHLRWHVRRNIVNPLCLLCWAENK